MDNNRYDLDAMYSTFDGSVDSQISAYVSEIKMQLFTKTRSLVDDSISKFKSDDLALINKIDSIQKENNNLLSSINTLTRNGTTTIGNIPRLSLTERIKARDALRTSLSSAIDSYITKANVMLKKIDALVPVVVNTTGTNNSSASTGTISSFFADNKYIVIGAVVAIGIIGFIIYKKTR